MKLAIIGASGHGKVIADLAEELGYEVCFYDDEFPRVKKVECWDIFGSTKDLIANPPKTCHVAVAIGNNKIRRDKILYFQKLGFYLPPLIHPTAIFSRRAFLDEGSVIMAGSVINAFAKIGKGVIINTNSTIEHDCIIGDYVHVSPNVALAGGTVIKESSWVGIGSCTKQLSIVGENSIVGANSVVIENIPQNVIAVGNPARVVKENK